VVVDHSPQAGPEEWWTGGASKEHKAVIGNGRGTFAEGHNVKVMQYLSVNYTQIKVYQCICLTSEDSYL